MTRPPKQGLYDPRFEKDSCGIAFVVDIQGRKSRPIVERALAALHGLTHRGAQGSDPLTGDGAGILAQIPHGFLKEAVSGFELPNPGDYGVGMVFLPKELSSRRLFESIIARVFQEEKLPVLGLREVPVRSDSIGEQARRSEPAIRQIFVGRGEHASGDDFERKLYLSRKRIENQIRECAVRGAEQFHFASLSSRTIIYKGMLLPDQVSRYYPDLTSPRFESAIALVHSRFSTNTFPSWPLAHPFRYLCHNGEINTIQGNVNWMRARQGKLKSSLFGEDISRLFPIVPEGQSDSACLDNALEFLVMGGRTLPHAMMMLIPEPWVANPHMDLDRRGFYEFHSSMMEPWDGPAAVAFSDGIRVGATLDRNGLRPCRYQVHADGTVVLASEAGVLEVPAGEIVSKGRLEPGRMFLVDTELGRIVDDEELKREMSARKPWREWVTRNGISLEELPEPANVPQPDHATLRQRQQAFGYTIEELKMVLTPMVVSGEEPISSMGNDTPLAVLSERPQLLFSYFKQLFAQVTNPPIDPIREQLVMSLSTSIGPKPNLLAESPEAWRRIKVQQPVLTNRDLQKMREIGDPEFKTVTLKMLFRAKDGPKGLRAGLTELCRQASRAIQDGCRFIILSDRGVDEEWAPIPSLLGVSAVHHHLVRKSQRAEAGLIVETGEPRDVHHFAALLGYGAGSVNPYLVFETLVDMERDGYLPEGIDAEAARFKFIKAVNKGLLKIFSKMGISTVQSYCGAQIFEAVGLSSELVNKYFRDTPTRIEGIGLKELAEETLARHRVAYSPAAIRMLEPGGAVHYRVQADFHNWNPDTISRLQQATRTGSHETYKAFADSVNSQRSTLRSLLDFEPGTPVPLAEVEPAAAIVKRFTTGAMSFGALGKEAHETLAVAMNRIGAKSNSGEGGEDPERYSRLPNGDSKSSAIKQVASARFGVTAHYLVNARELQIKIAQGAKPGEGGQLPGGKVDSEIARMRYSTPGVGLISPPPHHDIYSIEDLKQLIHDLKTINPAADVSVKLVAEAGVGTVAAGVAKAHADKILIAGDSGGTGASPLSSIKNAGIPWELGLAETHQTLVLNGLRSRVRLETDGQLKTGRDVVIAALLGAEEFGFSTAPLIVQGCIMMRKCHLNTCPVGIATQDPELRKKFTGQPEHVINYFFFVAEEVRELLARLGFRNLEEAIGRVDRLKLRADAALPKAHGLNLSPLLHRPGGAQRHFVARRERELPGLEQKILALAAPALERGERVRAELSIRNVDRSIGTGLSGEVARRHGADGLARDSVHLKFQGSAGQSFGAFLARGILLDLEGEANDSVGKGLSGGRIVIRPPRESRFEASETILVGNTGLYGATQGEAYLSGRAGERFAVRNSGAIAVLEGVGDHGCEYMTGGAVVVLGRTGRNFAAGMSGGMAFVLDEDGKFASRCNLNMVELGPVSHPEEKSLLKRLIENHFALTGSEKARRILERWEETLPRFVHVMPTDYKRALSEQGRVPAEWSVLA